MRNWGVKTRHGISRMGRDGFGVLGGHCTINGIRRLGWILCVQSAQIRRNDNTHETGPVYVCLLRFCSQSILVVA